MRSVRTDADAAATCLAQRGSSPGSLYLLVAISVTPTNNVFAGHNRLTRHAKGNISYSAFQRPLRFRCRGRIIRTCIDEMISAQRAKSDKSERARNAANQRHAKSKKARKDSRMSQSSPVSDDDGNKHRKERYREKNRFAAAKCRAKKKENIETIEDRHRNLRPLNNVLKKQVQELRGELTGLRTHALDHQDCNCPISKYNVNQARRVAMYVDTAESPTFPGYSQKKCVGTSHGAKGTRPVKSEDRTA